MLRIGLIGAGFMGNTHSSVYKVLATQLDIKLCAVADIRAEQGEKTARFHNAKYYRTADELINDSTIDVIDICLPTYLHAEYARKAMEAGKSVFLEKPAVLKPEEGEMLLQVQKETGMKVMVGQCIRIWPAYQHLKEVYDTNKYGNLKNLMLKRISPLPAWGFENWYLDDSKSGGAILDLHIHDADYMRYLLGEPRKISVAGSREHVWGIYEFASGPIVQIEGGWDYPPSFPSAMEYRASFENATVVYVHGEVIVYTQDGRQFEVCIKENMDSDEDLDGSIPGLGGYYAELKYFYECLLNHREIVIAPLSEGVKSVKFIYAEMEMGGFSV